MAFKEKKISIKELNLWDENARFPDQYYNSDEKELVKYFLSKPNFKIKELIEEIVRDFDLPHLEKIVVWDNSDNLIVIEGNRRLTGYKLLANPNLILDLDSKLYKVLQEKQKEISISDNFQLDCLVSEEKDQCYRYIDRKHSKGNNEVGWLEPERINYSKRRGIENQNSKIKIAITNFVKTLDLPEEIKSSVLGRGYVTTFYRFVATGPAKELFGLSTNENGELVYKDMDFSEKLKVIIHNVINKEDFEGNKVDTRELNKNPQITNYLKTVKSVDAEKVNKEVEENTQTDIFGNKSVTTKTGNKLRKTPQTKENNILFGRTLVLKIGKVNDLYRAIVNIYEKNHDDPAILPIIGMSMRLIVEVGARVYYNEVEPDKANKDQLYKDFLKQAKTDMSLNKEVENYFALTNSWLNNTNNIDAILGKYAHGNIICTKSDILSHSVIIGNIMEHYFKR